MSEVKSYAPRTVHPLIVLYIAEKLGYNEVPEGRLYLMFPYLKKRGFFRSGTYGITWYCGPTSFELGEDLLWISSMGHIEEIRRAGFKIPESYYKLTELGRRFTKKHVMTDEGTMEDVLSSRSLEKFGATVKEVLTKKKEEIIEEVFSA